MGKYKSAPKTSTVSNEYNKKLTNIKIKADFYNS